MLFIIRSLIYLFASVMCVVGIFFTYQDADNEYLNNLKQKYLNNRKLIMKKFIKYIIFVFMSIIMFVIILFLLEFI